MFPVNSPENKLDGLSDHMTTDNIIHSENICLSKKNMMDYEVIEIVPLKKCINDEIIRSEKENLNLPVVSDDTYNDAINCDQFDLPVVSDDTYNDAINCDQFDLPVVSDDTYNDVIV